MIQDAPVDLLLGMDLLGFSLTVNVSGDSLRDLLQDSEYGDSSDCCYKQ